MAEVFFHRQALKELKRIDLQNSLRIKRKIEATIQESPERGKPLVGDKKGIRSLRVGRCRVLYLIQEENILILTIRHRREVYKRF